MQTSKYGRFLGGRSILYQPLFRACNPNAPLLRLAASVVLAIVTGMIQPAAGEGRNGWIRGSVQQLSTLLDEAEATDCADVTCPIPMRPILLTVRTPRSRTVRAMLTSANLASPKVEQRASDGVQTTQSREHPVLLRGWIWGDGVNREPSPLAATITRSTRKTLLSLTSASLHRRGRDAMGHLTAITGTLESMEHPTVRNARVAASSRFSSLGARCGSVAPEVKRSILTPTTTTQGSRVTSQATYPALYIATDFDPQFASRARCSTTAACNNQIIRILHATSVLYETQIGYTLKVARQFGPTAIGESTIPATVLEAAQTLSLLPRAQFLHTGQQATDNPIDLFNFFTGRTMDDKTIGIAYVGTACRNDQSEFTQAVVQYVSDALNPVTVAHEIGHTLSATHTDSGIMRANISSNTPKSFASSSLLTISNHLSQWYSECRRGIVPGISTPTPTPRGGGGSSPSNPYSGRPVTVGLTIRSSAPRIVSITTTVTSLTPNCSVTVRGGTTSVKSLRGEAVTQFTPATNSTTKTGSATFRVTPSSANDANVYFVAEHSCADGTILEVSRVQKINPNRIRGVSQTPRSKRLWLNALRDSLR